MSKVDTEKVHALRKLLGELIKEGAQYTKRSEKLRDLDIYATRAARTTAYARLESSAEHIERLKHDAHCLAVEIGIADRRDASAYGQHTFGDGSSFMRAEPA